MDQVGSGARSRALGALYGLAIGDALGMPTQSLPRADIVARYGSLSGRLRAGAAGHPLAAGLPAGTVTDDTEQAVLLARLIVEGGGTPDPAELAEQLLAWEDSMRARGSLDLLGPSTRQALGAIAAGTSIEDAGRSGTTNGAAMRITPVGIATPSGDPGLLVDRVVAASRVTHNTGIALAGAAAVAAAVSAGIDGATVPEAVQRGRRCGGRCAALRALGRRRGRGRADHLGGRPGRRARPGAGDGRRVPAGRDQPGHPGIGARRVRGGRGQPATTPGSPAGSPPRWAATATRSPP